MSNPVALVAFVNCPYVKVVSKMLAMHNNLPILPRGCWREPAQNLFDPGTEVRMG